MKVPCALVGASLPGIEIKKAKVRGVESHGMLCSARELGLSEDHGGLLRCRDAPVGSDIRKLSGSRRQVVHHQADAEPRRLPSLSGIAREVAALTGAAAALPAIEAHCRNDRDTRAIELDAPASCPRYCGRMVRGVKADAPTPDWMKRRIERSGIRSISAWSMSPTT
jgi:phenylalanyl-tRNA synthetase beta chain